MAIAKGASSSSRSKQDYMFPVESAFLSVNHLLAFKLGLILEVLQRSAATDQWQPPTAACFFAKCNENESNFRSIKEFEARTSYLQPCIASEPMQQVCKAAWWHSVSPSWYEAPSLPQGTKYQTPAPHQKQGPLSARRAKKDSKQLDTLTRGKQQGDKIGLENSHKPIKQFLQHYHRMSLSCLPLSAPFSMRRFIVSLEWQF